MIAVAALLLLGPVVAEAGQKADLVRVDKGESRLDLIRQGEMFASERRLLTGSFPGEGVSCFHPAVGDDCRVL